MRALVLNAGSSSVKYAVYEGGGAQALAPLLKGGFDRIGVEGTCWSMKRVGSNAVLVDRELLAEAAATHGDCMATLARKLHLLGVTIDCAGHRVVHGGDVFSRPVEISATPRAASVSRFRRTAWCANMFVFIAGAIRTFARVAM